jgi:hypothetical protein
VLELGSREKDIIQGFAKSILKVRSDIGNSIMKIEQLSHGGKVIECKMNDLVNDYLFGLSD